MLVDQSDIDALLDNATQLASETAAQVAEAPVAPESQRPAPSNRTPSKEELARIMRLKVPVMVKLSERTMKLEDVLHLATGSIIEFESPSDADLQLIVGNQTIGRGQTVKIGEKFGLRISSIGNLTQRISALGKSG